MAKRLSFRLIPDVEEKPNENIFWDLKGTQADFVAMASHQLRTPLAGIKWALSTLLRGEAGELKAEQKKWLSQAYTSNEKMIKLIDEMLSSMKLERGVLNIYPESMDIVEKAKQVAQSLIIQSERKHITIHVADPLEGFPVIKADPDRIAMVFQNLFENALRYSPKKSTIEVRFSKEEGDIKVSVKDSGIGITNKDRKNIFERFFRAQNAFQVDKNGTGLGLYVAKGIIEKHGGNIWFESEEGVGTTFYFILPTNTSNN